MIQFENYRLSRIIHVQGIISADLIYRPTFLVPRHVHQDAWELCCCLEQNLYIIKDGIPVSLQSGQLLLVPPGVPHNVVMEEPESRAFVIAFSCSSSENLLPLQDVVFGVEEFQQFLIQQIIVELERTFIHTVNKLNLTRFHLKGDSPLGAEQMICSYLELILISLLRRTTMHSGQIIPSKKFREAIHAYLSEQITAYIREHIQEKLTVEQIAEHFHYSSARLSSIYKTVTGCGVYETITRERLDCAKKLLLQQEMTVAQISDALGYCSPQYFSQKFSQETGCPPSRYAAAHAADSQ